MPPSWIGFLYGGNQEQRRTIQQTCANRRRLVYVYALLTYSVNPILKKQISFNTFPSDFYNYVHQIVVSCCMEIMMSTGQGEQVLFWLAWVRKSDEKYWKNIQIWGNLGHHKQQKTRHGWASLFILDCIWLTHFSWGFQVYHTFHMCVQCGVGISDW